MMNTRNITKAIIVLVLLMSGSCKKFLNENQYSNISPENYFQTEKDAVGALATTYYLSTQFGSGNRMFFILTDMVTDDMDNTATEAARKQLSSYSWSSSNTYFQSAWTALYKTIEQANLVIQRVPDIDVVFTTTTKDVILGEAKFLRALQYFYLVQLWGSVPMPTVAPEVIAETHVPKSPANDIYNLIISDLMYAESVLDWTPRATGAATRGAAKSLLGKVYLTLAGPFSNRNNDYLVLAEAKLREVIESGKYDLVPVYADYFDINKKVSSEAIYEHTAVGDADASVGSFMFYQCTPGSINNCWLNGTIHYIGANGQGSWTATPGLWFSFKDKDVRKQMHLTWKVDGSKAPTYTINAFSAPYIFKYLDFKTVYRDTKANNLPVMRYADVMLMYAETLNELTMTNIDDGHDRYWYINQVRQRAFYGNTSSLDATVAPGLSKDDFRNAVMLERRLEFAHEGQRLFDLKRTGTFISAMTDYVAEYAPKAANASTEINNGLYSNTYTATYPNATSPTTKTVKFSTSFLTNTKIVAPEPKDTLFPIPILELQTYDIGQNPGF